MKIQDMVDDIKIDLGSDINSLGISDDTITRKIKEALRKISSYAPYVVVQTHPVTGGSVVLPEGTSTVVAVMRTTGSVSSVDLGDDQDLFSVQKYMFNSASGSDPYTYLTQIAELKTLQGLVNLSDWHYDKPSHTLYLSNYQDSSVTLRYLRAYRDLSEVTDELVIQKVKEYALALCKIIEGMIRRKLQSAPGAIQLDGDSLVSEGTQEKSILDQTLPTTFKYLRFGIRV